MKKTRRFAAIAAAAMMTACMAVPMMAVMPASAADTYTITISDNGNVDASKHTFEAYQIFTGDLSGSTLSNIQWGTNISSSGFVADLKADTTLGSIAAISSLAADADAAKVAEALATIADSANADALAKFLSGKVSGSPATSTGGTISGLAAGYYFVKDASSSGTGSGDAQTKFILQVVKNVEVAIKTDAPTLEKKIWHNDAAAAPTIATNAAPTISATTPANGWNDVGDNEIGDTVYFLTKTSVPDISDYDTYKYIIHDTLSAGLTIDDTPVTNIVYVNAAGVATEISLANVTVTVSGQSFTVDFGDLKEDITAAGGYIYTYYDAVLNENALISNSANTTQANTNTAYLEYSNNPNASGSGDTNNTGTTPEDTVYDWTFTFTGTKVDGEDNAVAGAGFTLSLNSNTVKLVEVTDVTNVNITKADDTKYYRLAKEGEEGITEIVTTDTANKFMILGLDDTVTYTLTETTTPAGYNTCDPVTFTLSSDYDTTGAELTSLKNGENDNATKIVNNSGSELPSTGGIGTTIFYVVGGVLVAGAGVTLIAKKRMKNEK